jgi:hypothetical protein
VRLIASVRGVLPEKVDEGFFRNRLNRLQRVDTEGTPGFNVAVIAVLSDGRRVSDKRYMGRSFTSIKAVTADFAGEVAPEPERSFVEQRALEAARDDMFGRWSGLTRALKEVGVDATADQLDQLRIDVELDDLARQLTIEG